MTLLPGQPFASDYELLRPLGEGGMGEVWLARERALGRDVALKIMRPSESAARALRFAREAQALAALDHPSILPVLRTGEDPATGLRFLATRPILLSPFEITRLCDELLRCPYPRELAGEQSHAESAEVCGGDAPTARPALVTRRPSLVTAGAPRPLPLSALLDGGKALPEGAVLRIARDLVSALAAAHAAGILHRDIKPSNVLFDPTGRALLADFGLAKFVARHSSPVAPPAQPPDSISLDESGARKFLGSPAYAAPESFREGTPPAPALDWYSLGAVLYEALTGERPRSLRKPSSFDPARISRRWDSFLAALLEPDPARRLSDPAAITRRLEAIGRAIGPAARRRHAVRAALGVAAVLAAAAALLAVTRSPKPAEETHAESEEPVPAEETHAESAERPRAAEPRAPVDAGPAGLACARPPVLRNRDVWQGGNLAPLEFLGTLRLAPVDGLFEEALASVDPETRRLVEEGDRAGARDRVAAATAWIEAATRLRDRAAESSGTVAIARAAVLARLSRAVIADGTPAAALRFCNEALGLVDPLFAADPARHGPLRSWLLAERAFATCEGRRLPEAVADLSEAGILWHIHAPAGDPAREAQLAILAASLGGVFRATGDALDSIRPTLGAIEALAPLLPASGEGTESGSAGASPPDEPPEGAGEESPVPSQDLLDLLAGCHYRLGESYATVGNRLEALASYRRALGIWRGLWRSAGETNPLAAAQVLGRIAKAEAELGKHREAVADWDAMLAELRPLLEADPARHAPVAAGVLRDSARALRLLGDETAALAREAEAEALGRNPE